MKKLNIYSGVFLLGTICFASFGKSQAQQIPVYVGNWSCSFVQQSSYVDVTTFENIKLMAGSILYSGSTQPEKFTAKLQKKNIYGLKYASGVMGQITILDTWMLLLENSEQTQICLKKE